ncbi:SdpI family protein [Zhouia sp. PK063]|uniref:SdpI family protein n=1 Tax=Zhouia sp. PK063 TaxID=3373602 RepID=UPI0037A69C42
MENYVNPLLTINVLTGIILVIVGLLMAKFPPKKINHIYGYRTISSMKTQERWNFAQVYSAKLMIKLGVFLILVGVVSLLLPTTLDIGVVFSFSIFLICIIFLIIKTERAIKNKFPL